MVRRGSGEGRLCWWHPVATWDKRLRLGIEIVVPVVAPWDRVLALWVVWVCICWQLAKRIGDTWLHGMARRRCRTPPLIHRCVVTWLPVLLMLGSSRYRRTIGRHWATACWIPWLGWLLRILHKSALAYANQRQPCHYIPEVLDKRGSPS